MNQATSLGNSLQQAQKISKEKLSQQLHEMNEQFDAIEQLTSNMEQDLQRSNRVRIILYKFLADNVHVVCTVTSCNESPPCPVSVKQTAMYMRS